MKNMNPDGTFKDVSANDYEKQKEELYNFCHKEGFNVLSKIENKNNSSVIASIKDDKPIFVGCRQVGKKKFKTYIREHLSKHDQKKWLLMTK